MLVLLLLQVAVLVLKIVGILVAVAYYTIAERKIMGAIHRRRGPNVVGFYGLLQPLADGLKLLSKELVIPSHANSRIFTVAPIIILTLSLVGWSVLPFDLVDYSTDLRHLSLRSGAVECFACPFNPVAVEGLLEQLLNQLDLMFVIPWFYLPNPYYILLVLFWAACGVGRRRIDDSLLAHADQRRGRWRHALRKPLPRLKCLFFKLLPPPLPWDWMIISPTRKVVTRRVKQWLALWRKLNRKAERLYGRPAPLTFASNVVPRHDPSRYSPISRCFLYLTQLYFWACQQIFDHLRQTLYYFIFYPPRAVAAYVIAILHAVGAAVGRYRISTLARTSPQSSVAGTTTSSTAVVAATRTYLRNIWYVLPQYFSPRSGVVIRSAQAQPAQQERPVSTLPPAATVQTFDISTAVRIITRGRLFFKPTRPAVRTGLFIAASVAAVFLGEDLSGRAYFFLSATWAVLCCVLAGEDARRGGVFVEAANSYLRRCLYQVRVIFPYFLLIIIFTLPLYIFDLIELPSCLEDIHFTTKHQNSCSNYLIKLLVQPHLFISEPLPFGLFRPVPLLILCMIGAFVIRADVIDQAVPAITTTEISELELPYEWGEDEILPTRSTSLWSADHPRILEARSQRPITDDLGDGYLEDFFAPSDIDAYRPHDDFFHPFIDDMYFTKARFSFAYRNLQRVVIAFGKQPRKFINRLPTPVRQSLTYDCWSSHWIDSYTDFDGHVESSEFFKYPEIYEEEDRDIISEAATQYDSANRYVRKAGPWGERRYRGYEPVEHAAFNGSYLLHIPEEDATDMYITDPDYEDPHYTDLEMLSPNSLNLQYGDVLFDATTAGYDGSDDDSLDVWGEEADEHAEQTTVPRWSLHRLSAWLEPICTVAAGLILWAWLVWPGAEFVPPIVTLFLMTVPFFIYFSLRLLFAMDWFIVRRQWLLRKHLTEAGQAARHQMAIVDHYRTAPLPSTEVESVHTNFTTLGEVNVNARPTHAIPASANTLNKKIQRLRWAEPEYRLR